MSELREKVDVCVVGAGHAGCEAALACARLGFETVIFTVSVDSIALMPCNPNVGGTSKGHLVREIDALGGEMGKNIDKTFIQSKMLNKEGQLSLGEDEFYRKYEQKLQLLTDKFMPVREEDGRVREQRLRDMEAYADYRNYLSFSMYEQVTDENGTVIRENYVDEMAGRDSGGEGQNPKYVALLAGFAMLYHSQSSRDSKIKLVLLDEAFSKMDQERSAVCLKYARKMDLQLIVCVPDERLQSLIQNVDCVYGFRRCQNRISMMHIDKGNYLELLEGES